MSITDFLGKKIFVKLKADDKRNGRVIERTYYGIVEEITFLGVNDMGKEIYLFLIKDKYGLMVAFSTAHIKYIEEQKI